MANIVLVHGAWHGGWCYRDTAKFLRGMGHDVFTPTFTGLGERRHQSGESVTLETHIRDVAGVIEAEELADVILCGHSYGGMVITGVADRLSSKIAKLIYIDAFVPQPNDTFIKLLQQSLPEEVAAQFIDGFFEDARREHSGMTLPLPSEALNIRPEKREWADRRFVPQAFATFTSPLLLTGGHDLIPSKLFILATEWQPSPFTHFSNLYRSKPGWRVEQIACGHDVMIDEPEALAHLVAGVGSTL